MNKKLSSVLIGVLGLAAIVFGIKQVTGGVQEMTGKGLPGVAEAQQIAKAAVGNLAPFASPSRGISLQYPKDWTTEEPAAGPLFFKFKTLAGVVNASVMAQDLTPGTALGTYVQLNVDQTEAMLKEKNMSPQLLDRRDVRVGERPATKLLFSYVQPDSNLDCKVTQVFVINKDRAYGITLTTPGNVHGEFDGLMEQILASVEFQ